MKGDEGVVFDDYEWFGHNRASVSRKAVRGSGGVLIKKLILRDWSVEMVDVRLEDIMLVKLQRKETSQAVFAAVWYFPPAGSSRDIDIEERFHALREQVNQFKMEGQVVVCDDFNARCGGLSDVDGEPSRRCMDVSSWNESWSAPKGSVGL